MVSITDFNIFTIWAFESLEDCIPVVVWVAINHEEVVHALGLLPYRLDCFCWYRRGRWRPSSLLLFLHQTSLKNCVVREITASQSSVESSLRGGCRTPKPACLEKDASTRVRFRRLYLAAILKQQVISRLLPNLLVRNNNEFSEKL